MSDHLGTGTTVRARWVRWVRWANLPPALFVVATVGAIFALGIPSSTDLLFLWVIVGLGCCSVADLRGFFRGLVRDWLPFVVILIAYDSLRGSAGRLFPVHFLPQIDVDRWLFGGQIPTVTLQRWLWHGHVRFYDVIPWAIYMTHFFFTPLLAAVLWKVNHDRFRWFVRRVIGLSFAGLLTYALYPAAPPWLAARHHLIAPITRIIPQVWNYLPVHGAGAIFEKGEAYANRVAAVPSLHAAFALLISVTVWPYTKRWLRPLVAAYPLAMAFSVIYTGEHYFSDVALGYVYASAVLWVGAKLAQRRSARAGAAGALTLAPGADQSNAPASLPA